MKCAFVTFGCKVNQYDTQVIRERLLAAGHQEAAPDAEADLYVVNTCAVTAHSERKARQQVHRLARERPGARIVVIGCAVQRERRAWAELPGVAAVAGVGEALRLLDTHSSVVTGSYGISRFEGHTRAFLKVQDGCDACCSYCIVPHLRGNSRSRPLAEALEEARRLVASGHREIVVTGIHVGLYGRDIANGLTLVDLLRAIEPIAGLERLRLSSIEVGELSEELLQFAAGSAKFCPHFHVPLQSGDDAVLGRMRRGYTAADYLAAIGRVKARLDRPAITSDVMVGFPGETEEAFAATERVCRATGFSRLHVFRYSERPGTLAATMTERVEPAVAAEREARLLELGRALALQFKQRFIGERLRVLIEGERDSESGLLAGYCDRYLRCLLDGPDTWKNQLVQVLVRSVRPERVLGEAAEGPEKLTGESR